MSRSGLLRAAASVLLGTVCGCSSEPVRIAPRPPMTPTLLSTASGSSCGVLLLNFLPMGVNERVAKARGEAQAALGTTDVADVRVRESWYVVPLIGTMLCTDVEQTAVQ